MSGADEALQRRLTDLSAKVAEAVAASVQGDNRLLYEANGQPGPYEEFDARHKEMWQRMQRHNGAFQRFEVLGTGSIAMGLATYVRLSFEKGARIVEYGWMGPAIERILVYERMPGRSFLPQSATEFAALEPRSWRVVRLRFEAGALSVSWPGGQTRARRRS